ncbi:MAG: THUMP domain-containing class I SAM-dependent RNA methyltransferase [Oscillospiraceae bacterium]
MPDHKLCVPCLFGLEGPLGNELRHMGLRDVMPENGRVRCTGTDADIARMNIRCRFGERVLLELGSFPAPTFDALFEGVKALPWADYLPADAAFPVKGYSLESALHSVPDCQKIIKKAVVESLKRRYRVGWFAETGALYQIQFSLVHDTATLYLDTTGTPLHKRGYRPAHVAAPLRETLAAALVDIAGYRGRGDFATRFAAAAPLPSRRRWPPRAARGHQPRLCGHAVAWLPAEVWPQAREEARAREFHGDYHIFASDIDPRAVAMARDNARRAGVDDCITFAVADAREFAQTTDRGVIVTNPPYGERLMEKREAEALYTAFGAAYAKTEHWRLYLLSSHTEFERAFGRPADKKRKLYNGTLRCDLFQYTKDV